MNKNEKLVKIGELLKPSEKMFGKGSMNTLGDKPDMNVEVISTSSIGLDIALGIGGLPKGRIIEIFGLESSGKTSICQHVIANSQKTGGICAFIDMEHAFDKIYAEQTGININELYFFQPSSGEEALNYCETLLDTKLFDVIVIDSVAALVPQKELEGSIGDANIGLQSRMMSQAMRKLAGKIHKSNCLVIFTNQIRSRIGVMFGDPSTTTGGNALKFYASVRLEVTRSITEANSITEDEIKVANLTKVKVIKNKVAPPFGKCEFYIRYGIGIDQPLEIFTLGVEEEIIEKNGNTYSFDETTIGVGRDKSISVLRDNLELCEMIKQKIYEKYSIKY